jgi:hypothetical protein
MKNTLLKLAFDSSVNAADIAAAGAADIAENAAGFTGDMMTAAADKGVSIGAKAREILGNKYVLGGLAAVTVLGAAYGTYRLLRKDDKVEAAPTAPVSMSPEQKVDLARSMLEDAQKELGATSAKSGKQTAAA